jgi:hypothetical protein
MSKVKAAPEKKRLSYKRDHYTTADEYPKGFRKGWPRKKAGANRTVRHKVARVIDAALRKPAAAPEDIIVEHIKRKKVKKHGTERLQERLDRTQKRRIESHGARKKRRERYAPTTNPA